MEIWNLEITKEQHRKLEKPTIIKISYRIMYNRDNKQSHPTIVYKKSWYRNHEYKLKQVNKITCY